MLVKNLILTALIALPAMASACGGYGSINLQTRHVAESSRNLSSETFTLYLDAQGREVRHGHAWQFDGAGNLIAHATWKHGKVWSGTRADIGMGCGVFARRMHFKGGKRIHTEVLKGKLIRGNRLGFEVNQDQLEFAGRPARLPEQG